ncbi:beta-glucosidase BglX [Mangrovihabitans endophyticus]|uniref:Exo-alpha-(1->6)-L-arabinopyranosidase n=1 Tax=Mangrovihabitans endophyticus TaxID=1751298 RepID=A0A8J3BTT9_9ACTN|nr:beta-glucosidase BglX [Mangrovihabitans endophyticus]GGK77887.1 beta-glucosidase [Mangrovihabitans endophyticus]
MARIRSMAAVAATMILVGVIAACAAPGRPPSVQARVDGLLARMTTTEKLEQLQLLPDSAVTDDEVRRGLGSVLSLTDPVEINRLQHLAVERSRLHIPMLFAFDTIHGFRTVFPIPLGAASSFDPSTVADDDRIGARESAAVGIKQIYGPMVDVSHEPRWGRIAEGGGEDPYLGSVLAAARVRAAQGDDYGAPDKVVASPKHYAAYGQPEGGRDYNTTDMSEQRLRNLYLPPFQAAVRAGAGTAMCSFNSLNGVPGCGNPYLETDILKREWGFDGFVESDWTAVAEMRACPPVLPADGPCGHGVAADGPDAAALALNAGTDSEMTSTLLRDYGARLLAQRRISPARLDDAVRRVLRVKFRAGLFEHPYVNVARAEAAQLRPDAVAAARRAASRSAVLLKNDGGTLPLDPARNTAVIGPLADDGHAMLGPWSGVGRDEDAVTVLHGIRAQSTGTTTYASACTLPHTDPPDYDPAADCTPDGFAAAVDTARRADQVVLALGESREMSGEAAARTSLDLPGRQQELIDAIAATGKPFVVVLFNGRPLTLQRVAASAPALLEAWFPGVQAGNAVADVLFGRVNPGGKLPVSFPRRLGQVPIYYNHEPTGRPCDTSQKWDSRYRDLDSCAPLYPFGYGLSYTTFAVTNLRLSSAGVRLGGRLRAWVDVTNTGRRTGDEVVQLYLHDPVASISQPVRRLRGFSRVTLPPGERRTVTFTLDRNDFGFYDNHGRYVVEPGRIDVFAGDSSTATLTRSFTVTR